MNHINEFDNLTKATRRREFDDGLMDYVFGGTFLFLGVLGWIFSSYFGLRWVLTNLIQNREITIIALFALIPTLILLIFGARKIIEKIRRQTLWKNRGFVTSLHWQVNWQTNTLASVVFIAVIILAFWSLSNVSGGQEVILRTLVSSTGAATGIVFYGMGKEIDLHRYKWTGMVGGILSILIIFLPISFSISWLVLGVVWIIVLFVSGSWALHKSILALEEQDSE